MSNFIACFETNVADFLNLGARFFLNSNPRENYLRQQIIWLWPIVTATLCQMSQSGHKEIARMWSTESGKRERETHGFP